MTLSYFNRNVYYETLKVGNLNFQISNLVLDMVPLLKDFVSASKKGFKSSSILDYFKDFFYNLSEDNLYEYLEQVVKMLHSVRVKFDEVFLYFVYLLEIPRNIIDPETMLSMWNDIGGYPSEKWTYKIDAETRMMSVVYALRKPIDIKRLEIVYIDLIRSMNMWDDDDYELRTGDAVETVEEASEVFLENKNYYLYFMNNLSLLSLHWHSVKSLKDYIDVVEPSDSLPIFTLHNYTIICGDVFIIHDPLLNLLPIKLRDALMDDTNNSIYNTQLGKDRADDMREFLSALYKSHVYNTASFYSENVELLLDDLK